MSVLIFMGCNNNKKSIWCVHFISTDHQSIGHKPYYTWHLIQICIELYTAWAISLLWTAFPLHESLALVHLSVGNEHTHTQTYKKQQMQLWIHRNCQMQFLLQHNIPLLIPMISCLFMQCALSSANAIEIHLLNWTLKLKSNDKLLFQQSVSDVQAHALLRNTALQNTWCKEPFYKKMQKCIMCYAHLQLS